jgi:hypothetical protein
MSRKVIALLTLGALALAPVLSPAAMAQGAAPKPGFTGQAASSVPGCPVLMWRLARDGNNVSGIAYYSDMSGASDVTGTVNDAGSFTLQLKSIRGNGPVGTVTGHRAAKNPLRTEEIQGGLVAEMTGVGCANMHLTMKPVYNLNQLGSSGGG